MSQFGGGKPGWGRPAASGAQIPGFGGLSGVGAFPMMGMNMPMINQTAFSQPNLMGMGVMGAVPQQPGRLPQTGGTSNAALGGAQSAQKNRTFVGIVTKMHDNYGFVDDDVFFQHNVIRGNHPNVGDKVMVEATFNPQMPFKWNAVRIQLLNTAVTGEMTGRAPSPVQRNGSQGNQQRWTGGAQDRHGPPRVASPRRKSPARRNSPRRTSPPRKQPARRKSRSPPRQRKSPPPAKENRKRERSHAPSAAPSSKRESTSPPRRRARIIPRYEIRSTKPVILSENTSLIQVKQRYQKLYVPSDFVDLSVEWSRKVPLDTSIDFAKPVTYHIFHRDVDYPPNEDESEAILEPDDADHRHQVKVILMGHAGKEEMLKKALGLLPDGSTDDNVEVTSLFKHMQFLVGTRGKELMTIGGSWSPSLDGANPENPATLIKTAVRTTKALTGVDLSNVPQWYSLVQVRYYRSDKDRVDRVHLLWPDTQMLMPEPADWEALGVRLKDQLDTKIAAVDALFVQVEEIKKEEAQPTAPLPVSTEAATPVKESPVQFSQDDAGDVSEENVDLKPIADPASEVEPSLTEEDMALLQKPKPKASHWNDLDVKVMKVAELKNELEARGIETRGIKTLLAQRLQAALDKEQELEEDGPPDNEAKKEDVEMKDEFEADDVIEMDESPASAPAKTDDEKKKQAEETQKKVEKLEKEKKDKKGSLEKHFTLPKESKVLVFPNKTFKGGKFDCKVISLNSLLDYRQDDNKETQFELSLFAEAFRELLERLASFKIYNELSRANDKDVEKKRRDDATKKVPEESEKSTEETEKGADDEKKKEAEKPAKIELKSIVSNRPLFEAFAMFDLNLCCYMNERDLEEIIYNGEFGVTRGQLQSIFKRLCSRDRLSYRHLTDNLVDSDGVMKYAYGELVNAPSTDVLLKGFGYAHSSAEGSSALSATLNESTDGTVIIKGNVVNVNQKLAQLKRSENERDSAVAALNEQTSLIAQLRDAKQELEKKKKDLEKDLDKTKKKLSDTNSALKISLDDGVHFKSAFSDIRRYADRILSAVEKVNPSPKKEEKEKKSETKDKDKKQEKTEEEEIVPDALVLADETGLDADAMDNQDEMQNSLVVDDAQQTIVLEKDPMQGETSEAADPVQNLTSGEPAIASTENIN